MEGNTEGSGDLIVHLKAVPNPDFGQSECCYRVAPQTVIVDDLWSAQKACREYIGINDLGGGNWAGGQVFSIATGKQIARISYNGRIWDPDTDVEIVLPAPEPPLKFTEGPWDVSMHPDTPGAFVIKQAVAIDRWAMEDEISEDEFERREAEAEQFDHGFRVLIRNAAPMFLALKYLCSDQEGSLESAKQLLSRIEKSGCASTPTSTVA